MREVIYRENLIGYLHSGPLAPIFEPRLKVREALEILDDLTVDQKLHQNDHGMPWVFQLAFLLHLDERQYISDEDLLTHILHEGYRSWTEVRDTDRTLHTLAYRRGFTERVEFDGTQVHIHGTQRQVARMTSASEQETALARWAYFMHTGKPMPAN